MYAKRGFTDLIGSYVRIFSTYLLNSASFNRGGSFYIDDEQMVFSLKNSIITNSTAPGISGGCLFANRLNSITFNNNKIKIASAKSGMIMEVIA